MSWGPGDTLPLTGRLLAVDPGDVRVGLALSDPQQVVAAPLDVIDVSHPRDIEGVARDVAAAAEEHEAIAIVVGWPRDLGGRETASASRARRLSDTIREATGLPVRLWDERLTTVEAERVMLEADASRAERRARIDTVAAGIILRGVLDAHVVARERRRGEDGASP